MGVLAKTAVEAQRTSLLCIHSVALALRPVDECKQVELMMSTGIMAGWFKGS